MRSSGSPPALLVDVGSTSVKAAVVDLAGGETLHVAAAASPHGHAHGLRREIDPVDLIGVVEQVVAEVVAASQVPPGEVTMSTQMHSALLTDPRGRPLSPIISWQDDRLLEAGADGRTVLDALVAAAPPGLWKRSGIAHRPGFGAANLGAWLRESPPDPGRQLRVHTVGSFVSTSFGGPYATHLSNAASLGVVDVRAGEWSGELLSFHGLGACSVPEILTSHHAVGSVAIGGVQMRWRGDIGDHQASVLGGDGLGPDEIAISLGTAGIVARLADEMSQDERVDSRPYPGGRLLQAVSRLPGGAMAEEAAGLWAAAAEAGGAAVDAMSLWRRAAELPAASGTAPEPSHGDVAEGWRPGGGLREPPGPMLRRLYEALVRHYAEAYRAGLDALYPGADRPTRVRFNGGLASRTPAFAAELAAALGLEVAEISSGDLALVGLRRALGIDPNRSGA